MSRPPAPGEQILILVKSENWEKRDTELMIFIHNSVKLHKRFHPDSQILAFGQTINMN